MVVEQSLLERMDRRQRQILVHSCIYYHFNSNVVPDHQYDAWGRKLAALIVDNPATFERSAYSKILSVIQVTRIRFTNDASTDTSTCKIPSGLASL